jgi:hypothetical protein
MRLHFTIRDLLWLTLVVAMGVAWWLDRAQIRKERETLARVRAVVEFDKQSFMDGMRKMQGDAQPVFQK